MSLFSVSVYSILTWSAVVRYLIILQAGTDIGQSVLSSPPKILVYDFMEN